MEAIINMAVGAAIMAAFAGLYMGLPKLKAWWASKGKADFGTLKADVASAHDKLAAIEGKLADLPALKDALEGLKARLDKAGVAV